LKIIEIVNRSVGSPFSQYCNAIFKEVLSIGLGTYKKSIADLITMPLLNHMYLKSSLDSSLYGDFVRTTFADKRPLHSGATFVRLVSHLTSHIRSHDFDALYVLCPASEFCEASDVPKRSDGFRRSSLPLSLSTRRNGGARPGSFTMSSHSPSLRMRNEFQRIPELIGRQSAGILAFVPCLAEKSSPVIGGRFNAAQTVFHTFDIAVEAIDAASLRDPAGAAVPGDDRFDDWFSFADVRGGLFGHCRRVAVELPDASRADGR
jgi:hypothetical protein